MAKKTIYIDGKPFTFEAEVMTYDTNEPLDVEVGRQLLESTQKLLQNRGIQIYLAYGTLLGAIREHTIIKGDEDIDVFTDQESELYSAIPYLDKNGLKLFRFIPGIIYSFFWKETRSYIDVYILKPLSGNIWSLYCYALSDMVTPKKYFKEYQHINFLGLDCMCPKDPEKIVEYWYGTTWRTPIRGHKFYYEEKSYYYWRKVKLKIKRYIMTLIGWPYWRHLILKRFSCQQDSMNDWKRFLKNQ